MPYQYPTQTRAAAATEASSNMAKVSQAAEASRHSHREVITISDSPVPVNTGKIKATNPALAPKPTDTLHRVQNGRVAKLLSVFGTAANFIKNQAPAPITPIDPVSKSGKGIACVAPVHSRTPPYNASKPTQFRPIAPKQPQVAHALMNEEDYQNQWRLWPEDPLAIRAIKTESTQRIRYNVPLMQCWNCCHCIHMRPWDEDTRKWRYSMEKDIEGTLRCHVCRHHCCPDCAIGGVEEKEWKMDALTNRHSGWALES